jgi:predicted ATPase/DNA-binding CsgD family transcriptional regulator
VRISQVDSPGPLLVGSHSPGLSWIGHTSRVGQRDGGPGGPRGRLEVRNNLPAEISTFVGRIDDLARCADLLRQGRLLTLTGAGGAGKTRLALRLAATLAAGFPGGLWWIDLAPLTGPGAVTEAVARAVPTVPATADFDAMVEVLGEVQTLLVLDNCEHLGAGVPEFTDRLLRRTRALRVLATSRGVLEVEGEIVWRVKPLAVPPADTRETDLHRYDAARLFVERAGQVRPDVTPQTADVVAVCRQLDGLPLALELAAARFRTATMTQILTGLGDRFALLTRSAGTAPSRQRTLLASVQWSHDLLTDRAQLLLRRLSVFAGGWTLDAARTVTGFSPLEPAQVGDVLAGLVDVSMVQLEDAAGAGRYRLLETIRAYASDRLAEAGETADLADRHLEWAADLAQELEAGTAAADPAALAQLEAEAANLHAALDHAASAAPASHAGLRLVAALGFFWVHRGYALAGDHRATEVIEAAPNAPAWLRARAVQAHAYTCFYGADPGTAGTTARAALKLAEQPRNGSGPTDPRTVGRAHQLLAAISLLHDPAASREHLTAALPAARQAADLWAEIEILQTFALSYLAQHRPALARPYLNQSRPLAEATCHRVQLVWELILAGLCDAGAGSFTSAAHLLEQGTRAARQVGDTMVELFAWAGLATVELATGNLQRTATIGSTFADADARTGPLQRAITDLMHVADALTDPGKAAHALLDLSDRPLVRIAGDHIRYRLAAASFLTQAGDRRAAEDTIQDTLSRCEAIDSPLAGACRILLARLRRADGHQAEAETLAHQGLAEIDSAGLKPELPDALEVIGGIAVDAGRPAEGLRLLVAADMLHQDMGQHCPHQATATADRERAAEALGSQAAEITAQAAQLTAQAAVSYARRSRGPRQRPDHGWDSLTPTEREVVQLVTEGLSNPDIADRLFISRATVKTHLSHVFSKLDVINRAQLVALATRATAEGTHGRG